MLVDDESSPRHAFAALLQLDERYEVSGEAANAPDALRMLDAASPTIVLTDLKMPGPDGIQLTKAIRSERPNTHTLVLSSHDESLFAERAILAGASGYVMKGDAALQLFDALATVGRGHIHLSRPMWAQLYQEPVGELTDPQHIQVFEAMRRGNPPAHEIARQAGMSLCEVDIAIRNMCEALQLPSETQLRLFAGRTPPVC